MKVLLVLAVVVACAVAKENCFDVTKEYNSKNFGATMKTCFGEKTSADAAVYECMLGPNNFNVAADKLQDFLNTVGISTRVTELWNLAKECVKENAIDYQCLHDKFDPICGDDEQTPSGK